MVEQTFELDSIFRSLSDPTRRDIIQRLSVKPMSIGAVAAHYDLSFAGVAKHVGVLERAGLVRKTREGKEQVATIEPQALAAANDFLETYRQHWENRLDSLGTYLQSINKERK